MDYQSPTPTNPIPEANWLTAILRKTGSIPNDVSVEEVTESKDGRLGKGNIVPYNIQYRKLETAQDNDNIVSGNFPQSLIVKYAVSGAATENEFDKGGLVNIENRFFKFLTIAREGWFLQEMIKHDKTTFSPPQIYHSIADFVEPEGMFIAMEDLRTTTIRLDQFLGAQGGTQIEDDKCNAKAKMSPNEAWKQAFEEVAITHARYWNMDKSISNEFQKRLKSAQWMKGDRREEWETSLKACRLAWNGTDKSYMSERVISFVTKCLDTATFDRAIKHMNKSPKTLVHGDFHAKNLFWHEHKKCVIMTDFSEVGIGNPISDLGQYVISDVETDVRRTYEKEVLYAYWTKLTTVPGGKVDPAEYPFSQCWESYKKDALDRFIWFFPMLAYMNWNSKFFHDQIDGFLVDHQVDVDEFVLVYGTEMFEK